MLITRQLKRPKGGMKSHWPVRWKKILRLLQDIKNKRVTREKVDPHKDKGWDLCLGVKAVNEVLHKYFASVSPTRRTWRTVSTKMQQQFKIKKMVVLGLLKSIVDKSPSLMRSIPSYWEAREEIHIHVMSRNRPFDLSILLKLWLIYLPSQPHLPAFSP